MEKDSERTLKENKILKQKLETISNENEALKKSLYDLSIKYNQLNKPASIFEPFNPTAKFNISSDSIDIDDYIPSKSNLFNLRNDLKGHVGAVYVAKYSNCGKYIASGSFDTNIKIWDTGTFKELCTLKNHLLNVSDVCWINSSSVLSGSFDQTVKSWSIESSKMIDSFNVEGFVQTVDQFSNLYCFGTSRCVLGIIDPRANTTVVIKNDSMVNSIICFGNNILSGDSNGNLKTWDTRTMTCVSTMQNENNAQITGISRVSNSPEETRYISVNSYDNVVRVYELKEMRLVRILKGMSSRNWPIRSSMYLNVEGDLMVGSGSSDGKVYLYLNEELKQRIQGHADRVYGVSFSVNGDFCSCSSDCVVKVWKGQ